MAAKKTRKKKVIKDPEPSKTVYVVHEIVEEYGGEICAGEENSNWPSHEPSYEVHRLHGVYLSDSEDRLSSWSVYRESMDVNFEPKNGQVVYVVAVTYSSGSTFGSSHGHLCIVDVFDNETSADEIAIKIQKDQYKEYSPWRGYFERIESVDVHKLVIGKRVYQGL